jgi:hypothetical protein
MSITDELREWVSNHYSGWSSKQAEGFAIADRIDAEHEKACAEAWDNGYESNYLGIEQWMTEHPQVMEHHGWVRLPKDADGEYIRVGDVMRLGGVKRDLTVLGIGVNSERDHDTGVFVRESDDYVWYNAQFLRHYHAPTVEDVLRDMHMKLDEVTALYVGEAIDSDERDRDEARIFAEYAKRLKLAEGEGE